MLSLPDFREKKIVICFPAEGQKISFQNDNLLIKDSEENIILQATCHRIFCLWIVGHTTLTTGILERSKKFGFSIYLLSYGFRPYGLWSSVTEGNFLLRRKQYDYQGLGIARHLVGNKIINQISTLKIIRDKTQVLKEDIQKLHGYHDKISDAGDLQSLLGLEGVSSRVYFSHMFGGMDWKGRKPRIKSDFVNTTLDHGYTTLFYFIECMLNLYGFDIFQGVYHRSFYQRKSLVCDLVEPFRCIIDRQVKRAFGLKQLQKEDFRENKGQYLLKIEKSKDYSRWMLHSILEYKEDIFSYVQDYYRCFIRNKPINEFPVFSIID